MKKKTKLLAILGLLVPSLLLARGTIQNSNIASIADIQSSALSTTANLTSGSACISSFGSAITNLRSGMYVYDTTNTSYINSGTTITAIPGTCSAGQVQMSSNANHNATGDTITFGGTASQLPNDVKIWIGANSLNETLNQAIINGDIGGGIGASTLAQLSQKMDNEHFGLYTEPLDNSTALSFNQAPSSYSLDGVLIESASSGATTLPVVWNPAFLNPSDKNTSSTTNWNLNFAGANATTLTTGSNNNVGTASVKWTKTTGATLSDIYYNAGSAILYFQSNCDVWFTFYMPTAANVSSVQIAIGTSTTVYQKWVTSTNYAGSAFSNGKNILNFNVCSGGTPASTGWNYLVPAQYFSVGVNTVSSSNADSYEVNGIYFSSTNPQSFMKVGEELTIYDQTNRESIIPDIGNSSFAGPAFHTAANLVNSYLGGVGSVTGGFGATITRQTLNISTSNSALLTATDQFGVSIGGALLNTQEARTNRILRSALSNANINAFGAFVTPMSMTLQAISGSNFYLSDPAGIAPGETHSGDTFHVFQVVPPLTMPNSQGKRELFWRGDFTAVGSGTQIAFSGNVSSSSTPSCLTSPSSTTGIAIGNVLTDNTHSFLPANTTVLGIGTGPCSSGQIQMSNNSTGTATGDSFNASATGIGCGGTCSGILPVGTVAGDLVVKDPLTVAYSATSTSSNDSYTNMTPTAVPNGVVGYDTGIPFMNQGNLLGYYPLGGLSGGIAGSNQFPGGGPSSLTLNGTLNFGFPFFLGQFGASGWSGSNFWSIPSGSPAAMNTNSAIFSIGFWFVPSTAITTNSSLISNMSGNTTGFVVYGPNAGGVCMNVYPNSVATSVCGGSLITGKPNYVYVTYSSSATEEIWLNGVQVGTASGSRGLSGSGLPLLVGGASGTVITTSLDSSSAVYGLEIWKTNNALTSPQLLQIYNSGAGSQQGFGPMVEDRFAVGSVSGQKISLKGTIKRGGVAILPAMTKMGFTK